MEFERQEQGQAQGTRNYEGSPWIHLAEWMIQEHTNRETGEPFWSVRLPDQTTIQHDGQAIDVSRYRFTTRYEPKLLHGEAGSLKAIRGIHFPTDWEITLRRFENTAAEARARLQGDRAHRGRDAQGARRGVGGAQRRMEEGPSQGGARHAVGKDAQEQTHPARVLQFDHTDSLAKPQVKRLFFCQIL